MLKWSASGHSFYDRTSRMIGNKQTDVPAKHPSFTWNSTYSPRLRHCLQMGAQLLWRTEWAENTPATGKFVIAAIAPMSIASNVIFGLAAL